MKKAEDFNEAERFGSRNPSFPSMMGQRVRVSCPTGNPNDAIIEFEDGTRIEGVTKMDITLVAGELPHVEFALYDPRPWAGERNDVLLYCSAEVLIGVDLHARGWVPKTFSTRMTVRDVIKEWKKGCDNSPCRPCFLAAARAFFRSLLRGNW